MFSFKIDGLKKIVGAAAAVFGLTFAGGAHAAGNLHDDYDQEFWEYIQLVGSAEALQAYLFANPEGLFIDIAREMLIDAAASEAGLEGSVATRAQMQQFYAGLKENNDTSFPEFSLSNLIDPGYAG